MRLALLIVLVSLGFPLAARQTPTPPTVNITAYGAKGDGVNDDGPAIQQAIDACAQGGVVMVPTGQWLVKSKPLNLRSGVTLQGVGTGSVILKGMGLDAAINATRASHIAIQDLKVGVEPNSPAPGKGRLAHIVFSSDVIVSKCTFDGTAEKGLPSQFSLCQFEVCNDVKCLDNHFLNTAGSATGVTGASWEPTWGHRSEFARNVIDDYCDTGIGIWTGASEANIHDNKLHGRAEKFTSCPVGIDVDGGTHSVIENNDISGGQIAIRLYDVHSGTYPIEGMVIRGNVLHDQLTYDAQHPAWAVKPENPKGVIEATFTNNRILESDPNSVGFMGGGAGKTVLHLDGNEFAGRTFLSFGGYAPGALEITSNGTDIDWKSSVGNNTVRGPKSGS